MADTDAIPCSAKHTKYQPTDEEFCCPKCGATVGHFCVDDGPNLDCDLLHDEDELNCYGEPGAMGCPAQYGTTGKAFAALVVKKKNIQTCPTCKGKGYVPKEK